MSKTYSKCSDCGRMDYIGSGTVCIACEREKVQQAIRDATGTAYVVCEKCSRRFAVGNVPTNVCDTCDAASRAEDFAKSLLRKADAEIARLTAELERVTKERDDFKAEAAKTLARFFEASEKGAAMMADRNALAERVRGLEGALRRIASLKTDVLAAGMAAIALTPPAQPKTGDKCKCPQCGGEMVFEEGDAGDRMTPPTPPGWGCDCGYTVNGTTPPAPQPAKEDQHGEGGGK